MTGSYDIVVVGAGIAGLYLAREAVKTGFSCCVIDQSKIPGEPNFSTAATPLETIVKFSLPVEGISAEIHTLSFGTKTSECKWKYQQPVSYVLDFRKMKQRLASEVIDLGGEVYWDTKATSLIQENEEIIGIKTSKGDILGKNIIDASGSEGLIAHLTDHRHTILGRLSQGIEYIIKSPALSSYKNTMKIFFDTALAPFGYAWVFHHGRDLYKIGICEVEQKNITNLPSISQRLNIFLSYLNIEGNYEILEKHGSSILLYKNQVLNYKNIMAVGDSAGTLNSFIGEGIRPSLYSAKFALEAIQNARDQNPIKLYKNLWRKFAGNRWKLSYVAGIALYKNRGKLTQTIYQNLTDFCRNHLSSEEFIQFAFSYDFSYLVKRMSKSIRLLFLVSVSLLRNWIFLLKS